MLLCVQTEAYPALNMHTMHHAHLLSIASFFAEFYTFVASLVLCVSHFNTTKRNTHVRQTFSLHLISVLACTWTVSKR